MPIRKDILGAIYLNQNHYLKEMQNIPAGAEDAASDEKLRTLLRGAVGKLLYLNLTRPDVAFKTNSLSHVPPGTDLKLKVKEARNLIEEVKQTKVEIKFAKLGPLEDLLLDIYADASFGGLDKRLKSTEGSLILLRGQGSQCSPISWRLRGITRVCKSAKSAETLALENTINLAIETGRQLKQLQTGERYEQPVHIKAFTDSESLIKSTKQVDEGSMRLHVGRLKTPPPQKHPQHHLGSHSRHPGRRPD